MKRVLVYLAVPVLYVLHQDFWNWDNQNLVFGLPAGLAYHVGYCVAAACLMFCLVRYAWPSHLEVEATEPHPEKADPWSH